MQDQVPDELLAQHLLSVGLLTSDQYLEGQRAQVEAARQGTPLPLGDVLVLMGVLTSAQRHNIEAKLSAQLNAGPPMFGHYKLLSKLGEGGMGSVYLAEDTDAQRQVALKILPPEATADPVVMQRFRQEAIATGKLNHENIVAAYTFDQQDGIYYYAMEYWEGEGLDRVLDHEGRLAEADALQTVLQVARGLQHAHAHGIIHRDIKPANVFRTRDGVAKILDLGLSKDLHSTESYKTVSGWTLGTPHYISPEQARGVKDLDGRVDIYSLGATLYHFLAGHPPFEGDTPAIVLSQHLTQQAPNPLDLGAPLSPGAAQVLGKMMAREREERYANCDELIRDLELVLSGQAPLGGPPAAGGSNVAPPLAAPVTVAATSAGKGSGRRSGLQAGVLTGAEALPRSPARKGATTRHEAIRLASGRQEAVRAAPLEQAYPTPAPPARKGRGRAEAGRDAAHKGLLGLQPGLVYGGLLFAAALLGLALYLYFGSEEQPGIPAPKTKKAAAAPDGTGASPRVADPGPPEVTKKPLVPAGLQPGLAAAYYRGGQFLDQDLLLKRVDRDLDFNWGAGSPDARLPLDGFSARWKGLVRVEQPGRHTFRAYSDDGSRLWIDGRLVYDRWGAYWGPVEGSAELSAGTHEVFIEYLEMAGQASYRLSWLCPGATAALPVPPEALWHRPEEDAAVRPANLQVKALSAASLEPPERWKDAVNLLALADPAQDAVRGQWKRQDGGLLMEHTGEEATLELPYQPPEEYTFRVVFVRQSGSANVKQILTRQGTVFAWTVDHFRRTGFENVGGSNSHPLASTMLDKPLENGREYTSIVQVRRDGARGWLDGKLVAEWKPEFGALNPNSVWALRNNACLGVGGYQCRALFRRIEVLEISGNGKVLRGAPAGGVRSP